MATALPPPSAIPRLFENTEEGRRRRLALVRENDALQLESRATIDTGRGPVRD
jgi:hypothetical protein